MGSKQEVEARVTEALQALGDRGLLGYTVVLQCPAAAADATCVRLRGRFSAAQLSAIEALLTETDALKAQLP